MDGGYDFRNDRFVVAMDYLQSTYLGHVYESTYLLTQDAVDRLPKEGAIEDPGDARAIQAIATLIERLPEDDERTGEIEV